jgi:hypothetical protein
VSKIPAGGETMNKQQDLFRQKNSKIIAVQSSIFSYPGQNI